MDKNVLKAEVYCQSSVIWRSSNDSEQILEAYGENRDQVEEEDDIEVLKTKNMTFESFEAAKISINGMKREYDDVSYAGVGTSQESVVKKLRKSGCLQTQQRDNLHGPFDRVKSFLFESTWGVWKKLLKV